MPDRQAMERLCQELVESLQVGLGNTSRIGSIALLCTPKDVADDPLKLVVCNATGRPMGVVHCSPRGSGDRVARDMELTRQAKRLLGDRLGRVILEPLAEGDVRGLSYAFHAQCAWLSTWRPLRTVQRMALRERVFTWLGRATAMTITQLEPEEMECGFVRPLKRLADLGAMSDNVRVEADRAVTRLATGKWIPRHVLMHGDLWMDNILISPAHGYAAAKGKRKGRFVIIDWGECGLERICSRRFGARGALVRTEATVVSPGDPDALQHSRM